MKWIVLITISIFNNDNRVDSRTYEFIIPSNFAECSFVKSDLDYIFKDPYNTTIIKGECYSEQEWRKKNI
tara:strand:+ start:45 stop:254 length:210 start_codon:yes stop_codon:yes gene_type:complete